MRAKEFEFRAMLLLVILAETAANLAANAQVRQAYLGEI